MCAFCCQPSLFMEKRIKFRTEAGGEKGTWQMRRVPLGIDQSGSKEFSADILYFGGKSFNTACTSLFAASLRSRGDAS